MDWKRPGRKRSWCNTMDYSGRCLRELRRTTGNKQDIRSLGRNSIPDPPPLPAATLCDSPPAPSGTPSELCVPARLSPVQHVVKTGLNSSVFKSMRGNKMGSRNATERLVSEHTHTNRFSVMPSINQYGSYATRWINEKSLSYSKQI